MSNLSDRINAAASSVMSGKELIARAITNKGVDTSSTASFSTMARNIGRIEHLILAQYYTCTGSVSFTWLAYPTVYPGNYIDRGTVNESIDKGYTELKEGSNIIYSKYVSSSKSGIKSYLASNGDTSVSVNIKLSLPCSGRIRVYMESGSDERTLGQYSFSDTNSIDRGFTLNPGSSYYVEGTYFRFYVEMTIDSTNTYSANLLTDTYTTRPGILTTYPIEDVTDG